MANTITPTFSFTLPEVGADTNAWGGHINGNFTTIDNQMLSRTSVAPQSMAGGINIPANGLNVGSGLLAVTSTGVTMSGTLAVAGALTLSSSVSGTSASFSSTLSVTSTATLSGNATVGGTLGVTGLATFTTNVSAGAAPTDIAHLTNKFYVDGQDALRLALTGGTLTGNLTISKTAPAVLLTATGGSNFSVLNDGSLCGIYRSSSGSWGFYSDTSGNLTAAGNVTAYSDARLKENVQTIRDAVNLVGRMRGVFYDRIDTGKPGVGVIAQEMQEIVPQVVIRNSDDTLSVAYGNLVGVLIEAVKELSARVEALEQEGK